MAPSQATPKGDSTKNSPSSQSWGRFLLKVSLLGAVVAVGSSFAYNHPSTQLFFMRFFRDVARARAHARLHGNAYALQVLMGEDEVLLSAATASRPFGNPDSGQGPVSLRCCSFLQGMGTQWPAFDDPDALVCHGCQRSGPFSPNLGQRLLLVCLFFRSLRR